MVLQLTQSIGATALRWGQGQVSDQAGQRFASQKDRYALLAAYYDNLMYESAPIATVNKIIAGLYRNTRPIHNPFTRAVDWYAGHTWPGAFTADGLPLPDGTPSCVPFTSDQDERSRLAMMTVLGWAGWDQQRDQVSGELAKLGDQFGEIEVIYPDDENSGKVYPRFHHPQYVTDLEFSGASNLIKYRLDIPEFDQVARKAYIWGKIVTKSTITTLYDGKPHGYDGQPAEIENPWGFVPAAWCQFKNVGGQHGASLLDGVRSKIDALNSSASSIHDYVGKFSAQGVVFSTDKPVGEIIGFTPGVATDARTNSQDGRQEVRYIKGPADLQILRLIENLGLNEAEWPVSRLIEEIERDLPESSIDEKLQGFTQPPSGAALSKMFSKVESRLQAAQRNADAMLVKLMQMGVSIGGELANSGAWGKRSQLTEQQQRFLPFSLKSWHDGLLDVTLMLRPLFPESSMERIQNAAALESLKTPTAMRMVGLDEDAITLLIAEQKDAAATNANALGAVFGSGG